MGVSFREVIDGRSCSLCVFLLLLLTRLVASVAVLNYDHVAEAGSETDDDSGLANGGGGGGEEEEPACPAGVPTLAVSPRAARALLSSEGPRRLADDPDGHGNDSGESLNRTFASLGGFNQLPVR